MGPPAAHSGPMLLTLSIVKMLAEMALLFLLGRGLLGLLVGEGRAGNPVYRVLQWLTSPVLAACGALLPRLPAKHLPLVTAVLLLAVWLLVTGLKIRHCLSIGVALCQ